MKVDTTVESKLEQMFGGPKRSGHLGRKRRPRRRRSKFGSHIAILLIRLGWDQMDLAYEMGTSNQNISQLLRRRYPRKETTARLCEIFTRALGQEILPWHLDPRLRHRRALENDPEGG